MREKYESLSAVVLKDLARSRGLKNVSAMKKSDLVDLLLKEEERVAKTREENQTKEAGKEQETAQGRGRAFGRRGAFCKRA